MTSPITDMFDTLQARGLEAHAFDKERKSILPRQLLSGGFAWDGIVRVVSVGFRPANLVTVLSPRAKPLGYFNQTEIGSFPNDSPCFQNAKGLFTYILQPTARLPLARFAVTDLEGRKYSIMVHASGTTMVIDVPPSPGLGSWITQFSVTTEVPTIPSWLDQAIRGIR